MRSCNRGVWTRARRTGRMMALLCLLPVIARADISVQLDMEHVLLNRMEPVTAFVTLVNRGATQVVVAPDASPGSAQLQFRVRYTRGADVPRHLNTNLPIVGVVEPGESKRMMVRLSDHFDFTAVGGYLVTAEVVWQGLRFATHPVHVDVVTALPVTSATRVSPLKPGVLLQYQVSYLAREDGEQLFLSVMEEPSGIYLGVFPLGRVVRVFTPVLQLDADGGATVVHQSSPGMFTRSLFALTATGMRPLDQSYERFGGQDGQWLLPPTAPENTKAPRSR